MGLECNNCHEEWYADGEEGQEFCPNCGVESSPAPCRGCQAGSTAEDSA